MKLHRPRGTRDFTPAETEKRRYIENQMRAVAENYGYVGIKTPAFEHTEMYSPNHFLVIEDTRLHNPIDVQRI